MATADYREISDGWEFFVGFHRSIRLIKRHGDPNDLVLEVWVAGSRVSHTSLVLEQFTSLLDMFKMAHRSMKGHA